MKKLRTADTQYDRMIRGMFSRYKQGLAKVSGKDRRGNEIELVPKKVNKTAL